MRNIRVVKTERFSAALRGNKMMPDTKKLLEKIDALGDDESLKIDQNQDGRSLRNEAETAQEISRLRGRLNNHRRGMSFKMGADHKSLSISHITED